MNLTMELLASAHQSDLRREARARRLSAAVDRCRRLLLGILPISEPCDSRA